MSDASFYVLIKFKKWYGQSWKFVLCQMLCSVKIDENGQFMIFCLFPFLSLKCGFNFKTLATYMLYLLSLSSQY